MSQCYEEAKTIIVTHNFIYVSDRTLFANLFQYNRDDSAKQANNVLYIFFVSAKLFF